MAQTRSSRFFARDRKNKVGQIIILSSSFNIYATYIAPIIATWSRRAMRHGTILKKSSILSYVFSWVIVHDNNS